MAFLLLLPGFAFAQTTPVTKTRLINSLKQLRRGDSQTAIVNRVNSQGIDFELTSEVENELRAAGARGPLIAAVRAKSLSPKTMTTSTAGIELVWIPPGNFMMGSSHDANEKPAHLVTFAKGFYLGKYEVTKAQWKAVMNPDSTRAVACPNCPEDFIMWNTAQEFLKKLNAMDTRYVYRLPTEAEWEYAARAGDTGDAPTNLDESAWYLNNSGREALDGEKLLREDADPAKLSELLRANDVGVHTVGTKPKNKFGVFDMLGNVWEWVEDLYHVNYYGDPPTDGSAWLVGGEQRYRILRGCSAIEPGAACRYAFRRYQQRMSSSIAS